VNLRIFAILFVIFLSSCATKSPQVKKIVETPPNVPAYEFVNNVPLIGWSYHQGSLASVAMVLQWSGEPITPDKLMSEMKLQSGKGIDLTFLAEKHSLMPLPVNSLGGLLKEVAAGHPVIVYENLGMPWLPQWRYEVVVGYDFQTQDLILHSGRDFYIRKKFADFDEGWSLSQRWGAVILSPGELAASANDVQHAMAANIIENAGDIKAAEKIYESILKKWPDSVNANLGLANIAYKRFEDKNAAHFLKQAQVISVFNH
jgi:hypothetical protein